MSNLFRSAFPSVASRNQIPSLLHAQLHQLQPNSLVRVRCMVQDMLEPEYFMGAYETAQSHQLVCGFYQDAAASEEGIDFDSPRNVTSERQIFYCVPVPGETQWASDEYSAQCVVATPAAATTNSTGGTKRPLNDDGEETDDADAMMEESQSSASSKRVRAGQQGQHEANVRVVFSSQGDVKHPLSNDSQPPCVVKVYTNDHGIKLNEVVEFFGFITYDNAQQVTMSSTAETIHDQLQQEFLLGHPSAQIPRVHCIGIVKVGHNNPLLPSANPWVDHPLQAQSALAIAVAARPAVIQFISAALGGDELAAEYVLMNLLSGIYARVDVTQLGRFIINLSGSPRAPASSPASATTLSTLASPFAESLGNVISSIVPKTCLVPLSLNFLNNSRLQPSRDINSNRLQATYLQISDGTHVLVDETILNEGNLNEMGVHNIRAVSQLVTSQAVTYDIPYQSLDFDVNAPTIILSEGKSMLPVDCTVPLHAHTALPVDIPLPSVEFFNQARLFLGICRQIPYAISEDMSKFVEEQFVAQRQGAAATSQPKMNQQDLFLELTIARLLALSHGESNLSPERWQQMKQVEALRKGRLTPGASTNAVR